MSVDFTWCESDRFKSNGGHGPLVARIVDEKGDSLIMERWNAKSPKRRTTFVLPVKYLMSPRCGWKREAP